MTDSTSQDYYYQKGGNNRYRKSQNKILQDSSYEDSVDGGLNTVESVATGGVRLKN